MNLYEFKMKCIRHIKFCIVISHPKRVHQITGQEGFCDSYLMNQYHFKKSVNTTKKAPTNLY